MTGKIKTIAKERGFGFIKSAEGGEFFFHMSALPKGVFETLRVGEKVEFDEVEGTKGPRAENVERA